MASTARRRKMRSRAVSSTAASSSISFASTTVHCERRSLEVLVLHGVDHFAIVRGAESCGAKVKRASRAGRVARRVRVLAVVDATYADSLRRAARIPASLIGLCRLLEPAITSALKMVRDEAARVCTFDIFRGGAGWRRRRASVERAKSKQSKSAKHHHLFFLGFATRRAAAYPVRPRRA